MTTKSNPKKIKWNPTWFDLIMEIGNSGGTLKQMYHAIGISATTAQRLRKEDADAEEAFSMATTASQCWWEREGLANLENRTYNTRLFEIMTKRFEEFKDTSKDQKVDVTAKVTIDFNKEVQELIKSLNDAK